MLTAAESYERAVTLFNPKISELISEIEIAIETEIAKENHSLIFYLEEGEHKEVVIRRTCEVLIMRGFKVSIKPKRNITIVWHPSPNSLAYE